MKEYTKWMESQPKWLKLVLCLWILDITWAIWRIFKAIEHNSGLELIIAILWIVAAGTIGWILDVVWILLFNYPFWFK